MSDRDDEDGGRLQRRRGPDGEVSSDHAYRSGAEHVRVPGRATPAHNVTTAHPAAAAARAVRGARGAAVRVAALAPQLEAAIVAGNYLESGRLSFEIRSALRRAERELSQLERDDPGHAAELAGEIEAARAELASLARELGHLVRAAPALEEPGAASAARERAWSEDVAAIAPRLGLGAVEVRSDDTARDVTEAKGARGVALGTTVYLHPARVQPGTADGREVLAHELVHLAQAQLAPSRSTDPGDRDAAEAEAAALAPRVAAGAVAHPRRFIDLARPAADKDSATATTATTATAPPEHVGSYFAINFASFQAAVRDRLASIELPIHRRLHWAIGSDQVADLIVEGIATDLERNPNNAPGLVSPHDPWVEIDQARPLGLPDADGPLGPVAWSANAGVAWALSVEAALRRSLTRMAERYLVQVDETRQASVERGQLVTSHPMDRVSAHALTAAGAVRVTGKRQRVSDARASRTFADGLRTVVYQWLGSQDPKLWNWIRVEDPVDARPEEVALSLFPSSANGEPNTHFAYAITGAAPFFALPPSWARVFPEAAAFEPREHLEAWHNGAPLTTPEEEASAFALAGSVHADEAALAQSAGEIRRDRHGVVIDRDWRVLSDTLDKSLRQLAGYHKQLAPWGLAYCLGPAIDWATKRREGIAGVSDEMLARQAAAIDGQQDLLFSASAGVGEVIKLAIQSGLAPADASGAVLAASGLAVGGAQPFGASAAVGQVVDEATRNAPTSGGASPIRDVLEAYGLAIGQSHLIGSAREQLGRAAALKEQLPLALMAGSMTELQDATAELRAETDPDHVRVVNSSGIESELQSARLQIRDQLESGKPIDAALLEAVAAHASEEAFRVRMTTLSNRLGTIKTLAETTDHGLIAQFANFFADEFRNLPTKLALVQFRIAATVDEMTNRTRDIVLGYASPPTDPVALDAYRAERDAYISQERRAAVRDASAAFEQLRTDVDLDRLFTHSIELIKHAALRKAIVEAAILIGITIATMWAGSLAGAAVRGAMLAEASADSAVVISAVQRARLVGGGVQLLVDSGLTAGAQVALLDDSGKAALLENLLSNVAVLAALRPFQDLLGAGAVLDKNARGLWRVLKGGAVVLRKGVRITSELVLSAAVGYVAQRLVRGAPAPDEQTAVTWAIQGASMAIGALVHGAFSSLGRRLERLVEVNAHLAARGRANLRLARQVERTGNGERALELLAEHNRILADEARLLADPAAIKVAGLTEAEVATLRTGNAAARADSAKGRLHLLPLRFAGLTPDTADGGSWAGTEAEIQDALHEAQRTQMEVVVVEHDATTGTRKVRIAGEELTITAIERRGPATKVEGAENLRRPKEIRTTAAGVAGSTFQGRAGTADRAAVLAEASPAVVRQVVEKFTGATHVEPAAGGNGTYVVTLPDSTRISVRIDAGPLDGNVVAQTWHNPDKQEPVAVAGGNVDVEGRYVIVLSESMPREHVTRALAHEVAEVMAERGLYAAEKHGSRDVLRAGVEPTGPLSPHDRGRLAELETLVSGDHGGEYTREMTALIEELGLRDGTPGADERMKRMKEEGGASAEVVTELERLRRKPEHLDADTAGVVAEVQRRAVDDHARGDLGRPTSEPVHVSRAERRLAEHVADAAAAKAQKSIDTLADLRAKVAQAGDGAYAEIDAPMVGAGPAITARLPGQLVIDAGDRWHGDPIPEIAQTAQQLRELEAAGVGLPREVADLATDRVPVAALRYWQDTLAAQGPFVAGRASYAIADGRLLLTITPSDGSAPITVAIKGGDVPVIASGFPKEKAPGTYGAGPSKVVEVLKNRLDAPVGDEEAALRDRLGKMVAPTEAEVVALLDGVTPELREKLMGFSDAKRMLDSVDAMKKWQTLRADDMQDGIRHVMTGDEVNSPALAGTLTAAKAAGHPIETWVIAGNGGTSVSAAESILKQDSAAKVVMVGADSPEGLLSNRQFRDLQAAYSDRLTVETSRLAGVKEVTTEDGQTAYVVESADGSKSWTGDAAVASLGRDNALPPVLQALATDAAARGATIKIEPKFDRSQRYTHYELTITFTDGEYRFDVTGAASRYAPVPDTQRAVIDRNSELDAPSESGHFAGGYLGSANQGQRYRIEKERRQEESAAQTQEEDQQ